MAKVVLVGYMGCGKSSVGKMLAAALQIPFVDLDTLIEEYENMSLNDLFRTKGELHFRNIEHKMLLKALAKSEYLVLGLGGGTSCYFNHHELLQKEEGVVTFYLKATASTLANRLQMETSKRPLLSNVKGEELVDYINKHLFDRSFYYHQVDHVVAVDDKSIAQIVAEISALLR